MATTKNALKTTEFFAMVAVNAAILIAAWVSDSLVGGEDALKRDEH